MYHSVCLCVCVCVCVCGVFPGQLRLHVMEALYLVEFKHIEEHGHTRAGYGDEEKEHEEDEDDTAGDGPGCRASYRLYAQYGDQFVCLNASRQLNSWGNGVLHANLSHSSDLLSARGQPNHFALSQALSLSLCPCFPLFRSQSLTLSLSLSSD